MRGILASQISHEKISRLLLGWDFINVGSLLNIKQKVLLLH